MDTIRDWGHFRPYGINYLTGESCGLGIRVLCDVTTRGWELLDEFFSNTHARNADRAINVAINELVDFKARHPELWAKDTPMPMDLRTIEAVERALKVIEENHLRHVYCYQTYGQGVNDGDPSSGSILLPKGIFNDLAIFCLLKNPAIYAVAVLPDVNGMYGGVFGYSAEEWSTFQDKTLTAWSGKKEIDVSPRIYTRSTAPGSGLRNQHAMWGFTNT